MVNYLISIPAYIILILYVAIRISLAPFFERGRALRRLEESHGHGKSKLRW